MKTISVVLIVAALACIFAGCQPTTPTDPKDTEPFEEVDYAASVKLDWESATAKEEVTVKQFVDGDTTHFYVSSKVNDSGVLKARYIAINTPESTGKIEEYGKAASKFTRSKLESATSIVIESDDANWNVDSTGGRYLVWIWYKTADSDEYRNLNIEILQEGLALASSSANNRYGSVCMSAINQAKTLKLNIYSGEKDPDFYYGDAVELDLKELRTNVEEYSGMKVAFNGIVTKNNNGTAYVEMYDAETDMYYGMTVFYGYSLSGTGLEILTVGNEARIVGTVQYYEAGKSWQVSGLNYRELKPDDPSNLKLISSGNSAAYRKTDPATFASGTVDVETEEGTKSYPYAQLVMSSSISMENLKVTHIYTTDNEDSSSNGAMTLTCQASDGTEISIRTMVLRDADGKLVTAEAYNGKTINVKGIVDYFNESYQIKVFNVNDIEIVG